MQPDHLEGSETHITIRPLRRKPDGGMEGVDGIAGLSLRLVEGTQEKLDFNGIRMGQGGLIQDTDGTSIIPTGNIIDRNL